MPTNFTKGLKNTTIDRRTPFVRTEPPEGTNRLLFTC